MRPVAEFLSKNPNVPGVLECLQTSKTIAGQLEELHAQLVADASPPVTLVGFSWGAWLGCLFASRYPDLVRKLVLVSAGAFLKQYNRDLMPLRMQRLSIPQRNEAGALIAELEGSKMDDAMLKRFGELMAIADSFEYDPRGGGTTCPNMDIYRSIWPEAVRLRDSGELLERVKSIQCAVVAMHGDHDSHPMRGVEEPLARTLANFRMIRLEKCGHTPWFEKYAGARFYEALIEELRHDR
ncbi:hypothetical protein CKA38_08110 [Ereboglobus luteus]|uniref:AB hydrolase-1 domain-containing protein n=2 Tax=Ereboglobus luteus TaxID=1796921 RepID=A0A2U8E355_9BACT|nr:hypothetical protein CKA38_08110 [Ereboglobus luteus]